MTDGQRAASSSEALRLNARYVEEVVIGWDLCPWAARAWIDGQVVQRVFTDDALDAGAGRGVHRRSDREARRRDRPRDLPARRVHGRRLGELRGARPPNARRHPFLAAAFHPDYRAPGEKLDGALDAARLVPFIRRTPDPTLQLVRASLVDRLRGEVSADVGRANFANVTGRGLDKLDALLADIRRDRDATYARLW